MLHKCNVKFCFPGTKSFEKIYISNNSINCTDIKERDEIMMQSRRKLHRIATNAANMKASSELLKW